jgi:hypothetical protein
MLIIFGLVFTCITLSAFVFRPDIFGSFRTAFRKEEESKIEGIEYRTTFSKCVQKMKLQLNTNCI